MQLSNHIYSALVFVSLCGGECVCDPIYKYIYPDEYVRRVATSWENFSFIILTKEMNGCNANNNNKNYNYCNYKNNINKTEISAAIQQKLLMVG